MINTIIFDIGRVLAGYGWETYLRGIVPEEEAYRAVEKAVFLNPAWAEHDKGLLTEEEEILDFASEGHRPGGRGVPRGGKGSLSEPGMGRA